MSVVVFGGPGGVGTLIIDELLSDGYAVTADLRNPAKVPDRWAPKVRSLSASWPTPRPSIPACRVLTPL
jgi:uncharacterized protein YbjT (DUF2867 family)